MPTMQPVPPATGTLQQAWQQIATKPDRAVIAAWSQAANLPQNQSWVQNSIIVGAVIQAIAGLIAGIIVFIAFHNITGTGVNIGSGFAGSQVASVGGIIVNVIEQPLRYVGEVLALAFGLALFMPESYGSLQARFQRALKPLALAQIGVQVVGLVFAVIASILAAVFSTAAINSVSSGTVSGGLIGGALAFGCLTFLASAGFVAYAITVLVQSGSVASNLNRWAVFGIAILAGIAVAIAVAIINLPLGLLNGI